MSPLAKMSTSRAGAVLESTKPALLQLSWLCARVDRSFREYNSHLSYMTVLTHRGHATQSGVQPLVEDKGLVFDVLQSLPTRRETKSYRDRFRTMEKPSMATEAVTHELRCHYGGVNLGNLYAHTSHERRPMERPYSRAATDMHGADQIHIALVKLLLSAETSDETMTGIGRTLSQLATLGMTSIIVIDEPRGQERHRQANRFIDAMNRSGQISAQFIDHCVELRPASGKSIGQAGSERKLTINHRKQLESLLRRRCLPIIPCQAISFDDRPRVIDVSANAVVTSMVSEFAVSPAAKNIPSQNVQFCTDRIIILDPFGGIPAMKTDTSPHVYINMEQEYEKLHKELSTADVAIVSEAAKAAHLTNLRLLNDTLALLPPTSSAFITTPEFVARSQNQRPETGDGPRVRTRRQRNPLIHNLLTDKPAVSSSLPYGRSTTERLGLLSSTFVKRGMHVNILPDPDQDPWHSVSSGQPNFSLSRDPRIDLPRLVNLIEKSFGRRLNVAHYLSRIENQTAGIVIVGDYDGCAIFTLERPASFPDDLVPYLDKFAVLPKWQGTGIGVADIIFKAMITQCFPSGVCWRSRSDNAVNKWYFERAKGTCRLPGTNWSAFWTTEDISLNKLKAYEQVCRAVTPSWEIERK